MADIARRAGVSAITVSRTLNQPHKVRAETRERVQQAMVDMDYLPDLLAGALASRRSRLVGVIIPTLTNSLFADTLSGLADAITAAGYQLLVGSSGYNPTAEHELVKTLLSRRVDGLVLTGTVHARGTRELIRRSGIPVFEMWSLSQRPLDTVVGFSNYDAALTMTRYLLDQGFARIGFLGGLTEHNDRTSEREAGYDAALAERGFAGDERQKERRAFDVRSGAEGLAALLDREPALDAVFAASDVLAVGAVFECQRRGWSIPQRIAIAGMDDSILASELTPPLTTIRIPRREIGDAIGQRFLSRLAGQDDGRRIIDLGFEVIPRESTRRFT